VLQDTNAMTEVALALSMAFFTVLVLALVSMGVPAMNVKSPQTSTVTLSTPGGIREIETDEVLLIYFASTLYNDRLEKINQLPTESKMIVAVPGTVSLEELIGLQIQFENRKFSITTLDEQWQERLKDIHR
jgi:hypothetical protein